jgi:hypothetical protein
VLEDLVPLPVGEFLGSIHLKKENPEDLHFVMMIE